MFALDNSKAADSGSDEYARSFREFVGDGQTGLLHGAVGCCDGVMNERVHFLEVFLFEPLKRIEVLNLRGDFGGKLCGVEPRDGRDAAASLAESLPRLFGSRPQRRDQTNAGDNDSSFLQNLNPLRSGTGPPATISEGGPRYN